MRTSTRRCISRRSRTPAASIQFRSCAGQVQGPGWSSLLHVGRRCLRNWALEGFSRYCSGVCCSDGWICSAPWPTPNLTGLGLGRNLQNLNPGRSPNPWSPRTAETHREQKAKYRRQKAKAATSHVAFSVAPPETRRPNRLRR